MKRTHHFLTIFVSVLLVFVLSIGSFAAMLGDVDADGKISAADARLALRASVGLEKYAAGTDPFFAANVDGDERITAADARLILRASVGLEKFTQPEPAHVHTFGEWTAEKTGAIANGKHTRVCTVCGEKETGACSYGAAKETRAATCTSANVMTQTCSVCGGQKTVKSTVAALGHDKIPQSTKAATCTERGQNVYLCKTCDKTVVEYVSALGHDFSTSYTVDTPPTCTDTGIESQHCSRCDAKQKERSIPALGHSWDAGEITTPATCTAAGVKTFYCTHTGCTETKTEAVMKLGHDFSCTNIKNNTTLAAAASCLTGNVYYYTCSRCAANAKDTDKTKTYEDKDSALGHIYTETYTDTVFGKEMHGLYCSRCNKNTAQGFNDLVNALKENQYANAMDSGASVSFAHTVTYLTKNTMTSDCDKIDFGIYTLAVKDLYAKEMNGEDVSYSPIYKNRHLSALPIPSNTIGSDGIVSEIEDGDATIKVEKINGLSGSAVLSAYAENDYMIGSTTYDLSGYKAKTISGDILKITVTAKQENYFGNGGVQSIPSTQKTALQKLTGYDIRTDAAEFGDDFTLTEEDKEEGVYDIRMDMKLNQITSGATVTYYFRAADLAPIAAVYNTTVFMDQNVNMRIEFFNSDLTSIKGTMHPTVNTVYTQTYLFSDFFEK